MKKLLTSIVLVLAMIVPHHVYAQSVTSRQNLSNAGAYSSGATYQQSWVVVSGGIFYVSLVSNNIGHTPATSPTQWSALGSGNSSSGVVVSSSGYSTLEATVAGCAGVYPCQINLNSALTMSTSGTYTIPAGVFISGQAGASIMRTSGQVLDFASSHFIGPASPFFLGTGTNTGMSGPVSVEWFGAIGVMTSPASGAPAAASSGPDYSANAQAAINAITMGGYVELQTKAYRFDGITVTKFGSGIQGIVPYVLNAPATTIVSNSATNSIIALGNGSSGSQINFLTVKNLSVQRMVHPTGTATGISVDNVGGLSMQNVYSNDSQRLYYFHMAPSFHLGVYNAGGSWGTVFVPASSYTADNMTGFYVDSADGNPQNSLFVSASGISGAATAHNGSTSTGVLITGTALEDVIFDEFQTSETDKGVTITALAGGIASDIHFVNATLDNCLSWCAQMNNLVSSSLPTVTFLGGHMAADGFYGVDIENSSGVQVIGVQIANLATGDHGIYMNGSNNLAITGNQFYDSPGYDLGCNGTTGSSITGNTFTTNVLGIGASSLKAIDADNGCVGNIITGNAVSGSFTTAYSFDSTSLANDFGGNSCFGSIGVCISGVPTGTTPSFLAVGSRIGGLRISSMPTAPTGSCSVISWIVSDDGHMTYCNGTTYSLKF